MSPVKNVIEHEEEVSWNLSIELLICWQFLGMLKVLKLVERLDRLDHDPCPFVKCPA